MDSRGRPDGGAGADTALDFVRFCHRRRSVGWPELYDEMCAVASRGLYRGWGFVELAERGIGFGLSEMPRLAALASRVVREESDRRNQILARVMARVTDESGEAVAVEAGVSRVLVGAH